MEIWKPVPDYEDRYEVSNLGNVRSKDVEYYRIRESFDGSIMYVKVRHKGRLLRPGKAASGHLSVVLGRGNTKLVHQLVLSAFVGPRKDYEECLHINHVPSDNRLENLKYGTEE